MCGTVAWNTELLPGINVLGEMGGGGGGGGGRLAANGPVGEGSGTGGP